MTIVLGQGGPIFKMNAAATSHAPAHVFLQDKWTTALLYQRAVELCNLPGKVTDSSSGAASEPQSLVPGIILPNTI